MNRLFNRLSILIVPLMALVFSSTLAFSATIAGGTLTTDTTWTLAQSPYIITGTVTVQGVDGADGITTLTIEPGVELRFNTNTFLYIGGYSGNPGALRAVGNASQPITFTSNQTTPWAGINFQNTSHDATSLLTHCVVEKAGQSNIRIDSASPAIRQCSIRESSGYGVYINIGSPEISNCAISANTTYGVYNYGTTSKPVLSGNTFIANGSYPLRIGTNTPFSGNTFTGNTIQAVEMFGEALTKDNTFKNIGVPYHITSHIYIQGTDGADGITTLTIEPGVELRFNSNINLNVGGSAGYPAGALRAIGNESQPIKFTSNQTSAWGGIWFQDTCHDATSVLDYCIVEKAVLNIRMDSASPAIRHSTIRNSEPYGIYINTGSPEISNNTIISNKTYGLYCANTTSKPILSGNSFTNNGSYPLRIGANTPFSGNTFTGNTIQAVEMFGEALTKDNTFKNIGVPYHITSHIYIQGTDGADGITTLTIEPGVELRFNSNINLNVGGSAGYPAGALRAIGNESQPIKFTSNQTSAWGGIWFQDTCHDATTILDHCIVEKAAQMNIRMDSASPAIRRSDIRNSGNYGIYMNGAGCNTALVECNSIRNNFYGMYTAGCSQMFITNNNITDNTSYGIYHTYSSKLNATRNWWGIATGPGNTSNKVYGNVETAPFLKSERNCDILPPTDDTDSDNLPDSWELQYFGDLNQNDEGDYDNDGISNIMEYILGSAPNDIDHITPNSIEFEYDGCGRIIKNKIN